MRSYTVFQFTQRVIENRSTCHVRHACRRLPTPGVDVPWEFIEYTLEFPIRVALVKLRIEVLFSHFYTIMRYLHNVHKMNSYVCVPLCFNSSAERIMMKPSIEFMPLETTSNSFFVSYKR
jgi:hypothetical protein